MHFTNTEVAFELGTRVDGRTTPYLSKDPGPLELVKVPMDRHF
ncbi:hypothetical protein AGR7B_pAt0271 [Agrobacterium deltaense RV3]|nr:hypothetical protein AGR7B_pAt0271 [Agrobacterium deltaense RV3]